MLQQIYVWCEQIGRGEQKEMTDVLFKLYAEGHVSANEAARKLSVKETTRAAPDQKGIQNQAPPKQSISGAQKIKWSLLTDL